MDRFEHGKLHSGKKVKGKKRKIVHNKKQAKAILLSYLRKEHRIPARKGAIKRKHRKRMVAKR
jgi:hypothetical protein